MKTINLNFYRDPKAPEEIGVLKRIAKEQILDKQNGMISFDWSMEQCGLSVWYTIRGYFGTGENKTFVSITYTWL